MQAGVQTLSEREKETLRLLLSGHDAKSAAVALGLSVHTINERLRDARRKLGVGSSRAAARLLAQVEGADPNFSGDKLLGVATTAAPTGEHDASDNRRRRGLSPTWLLGGMTIMFAIVAAVAVTMTLQGAGQAGSATPPAASVASAPDKPVVMAAESWVKLLDGRRWADSWKASGAPFRSKITETGWASTIEPLRSQLGSVTSRAFRGVTSSGAPAGAPDGEYRIVQFATAFANKPDSVETVVLAREGSAWVVEGYFIR